MSVSRLEVSYENKSLDFYRKNQEFQKQFCHIYSSRLAKLGELIKAAKLAKFGSDI